MENHDILRSRRNASVLAQISEINVDGSVDIFVLHDEQELYYENGLDLGQDWELVEEPWEDPKPIVASTFQLINKEFGGIGEVSIQIGTDSKPYFHIWFDRDCANDFHSTSFEYRDLEEMMNEWEVI